VVATRRGCTTDSGLADLGDRSNADHAVQRIELYIDHMYRTSMTCDDIDYNCALSYKLSLRRLRGQHTATFKSYDWMGNPAEKTVTFTVG
jgi:hypothetical protein